MVSQRIINWIKGHEGLVLYPYFDDYAGTPNVIEYSIGYGHQIQPNESYLFNGITKDTAEKLLIKDITAAQILVKKYVNKHLNAAQLDALTNLVYSIGIGGALNTVIPLINAHAGKKTIVPVWLNTGIYWQGKKWPNLVKGRQTEVQLYYNNQWQTPALIAGGILASIFLFKYITKNKHNDTIRNFIR